MEIYPDHIYGGVPVFKPTWDQFKDFRTFVTSVRSYGYNSGIIKIIPPAEWYLLSLFMNLFFYLFFFHLFSFFLLLSNFSCRKAILPKDLTPQLSKILIRNPCQQIIQRDTTVGYYVVRNVESEQSFTVKEWAELCETPEHSTPLPKSKTNSKSSVSDYLPLRKKKKHAGKLGKKSSSSITKRNQGSAGNQVSPKTALLKKNNLTVTLTPPETPPKARKLGTNKETKMHVSNHSSYSSNNPPSINNAYKSTSHDTTSDESEIEEEEVVLTSDQMGVIFNLLVNYVIVECQA